MVSGSDRSADSLRGSDGPVLVKGLRSGDRGRVDASGLVDVIGPSIGSDSTFVGKTCAGIVGTERLENIVLDEWVRRPAVNGQVCVAIGTKRSTV